jgi:hypothetical protein
MLQDVSIIAAQIVQVEYELANRHIVVLVKVVFDSKMRYRALILVEYKHRLFSLLVMRIQLNCQIRIVNAFASHVIGDSAAQIKISIVLVLKL